LAEPNSAATNHVIALLATAEQEISAEEAQTKGLQLHTNGVFPLEYININVSRK
jgi:hypothetical protein